MRGNGFLYLIKEGFKYFWTNKLMSLTSVSVLATCILITGSFWAFFLNAQTNLQGLYEQNEIVIFVDDAATDAEVTRLGQELNDLPNVEQVVFISKEEGLASYAEQYEEQAELVADLYDDNPLRDCFRVSLIDLERFDEVLYQIGQLDGVGTVKARADIAEKLVSVGRIVTMICTMVMVLLFAVSLFIIVNTIKLTRFVYRKEINIMKYVGATDWFIRWPFIIDGALIGVVAGLLSFVLEGYLYNYTSKSLESVSFLLSIIPFEQLSLQLLLASVGFGVGVGVLGSGISIRKYLDV